MIPGTVSKLTESTLASATTIKPKTDVVYLTGTTAVVNINPAWSRFSQPLFIVTKDGIVNFTAAGNIAVAVASVQNKLMTFVYSRKNAKWYST